VKSSAHKLALLGLQYSLGLVLVYECSRLIFSAAGTHAAVNVHLPHAILLIIALAELLGAILFLVPPTLIAGGRLLLATFLIAAAVHILHGQPNIGFLVIYAMAVLVVMTGRG
jgi:hypothetical protein